MLLTAPPKIIVLAILNLLAFCQLSLAADKIKIGVANYNLSNLTVGVAQRKGFFKEEGIESEIIAMRTNVVIAALMSGDLDYATLIGSIVGAAARGSPVKLIAVSVDRPPLYFVTQPRIKSVGQLKGATIGVGSYGTNVDLVARRVVKYFGIDPEKEIRVLALGTSPARLAALQQGIADVIVVAPPDDIKAKTLGFNVLVKTEEIVRFPYNGLGTSVRKIEQKPGEVVRALRAIIKANRFIRSNKEGTIQVLVDWAKASREEAAASYDSAYKSFSEDGNISDDDIRTLIENMLKDSKASRPILPGDVADLNPLRQAQKELGLIR
jgi:NitT/TauT family transport system substrate-binding protein